MNIRLTSLTVAVLAGAGIPAAGAAQVMADAGIASRSVTADPGTEAVRVEGIESLLVKQIAEALGRQVLKTRVAITGSIPPAIDSLEVVQGGGRWIVTFFADEARIRRFARAGRIAPVPVAARPIDRGTVLSVNDIDFEHRTVWDDDAGPARPVEGLVAQRAIRPGEVLEAPGVRPPFLVRGGDAVEAVFEHSGILMTLRGEALGTARLGDQVRVRLPSGVRMEGTVVGAGQVELNGGGR